MPKHTALHKSQAAWLAAIGEPNRLAIIRALAPGEMTVIDVAATCGLGVELTSHHLRLMLGVGVVAVERDGRFMRYSLVKTRVTAAALTLTHPSGLKVVVPLG